QWRRAPYFSLLFVWKTPRNLNRHAHIGAQAAERRIAERDVAAVRTRNVAGNGEAETGAALILIACVVQSQERLEHVVAHRRRNPRTVVVSGDIDPAVVAMAGDRHRRAVAAGIGHEIGEAALEGRWPHRDFWRPVEI